MAAEPLDEISSRLDPASNSTGYDPTHDLPGQYSTGPTTAPLIVFASFLAMWTIAFTVPIFMPRDTKSKWKFRNLCVSLVHSSITGFGALICFYIQPSMMEDMVLTGGAFSYCIVCISIGYFFYDMVDMVSNFWTWEAAELVVHHTVVVSCFISTAYLQKYIGLTIVALLVEVNGVCLHLRQLMQLAYVPKQSLAYRINSLINFGTFVPFRIIVVAWMIRWQMTHPYSMPTPLWFLVFGSSLIIMAMYIFLLHRLVKKDLPILCQGGAKKMKLSNNNNNDDYAGASTSKVD